MSARVPRPLPLPVSSIRPKRPRMSGDGADRTDLRNAERYVADHAATLRYVGTWSKWLAWDGKRWVTDDVGAAERLAKDTVRRMLDDARADLEADLDGARKAISWAVASHDAKRIRAMVSLARSAPELAVRFEALDAEPWALNVANGTLDLRTGALRPHDPRELHTKLAPVPFDPSATCPTWEAFLARAMAGNARLLDFLARLAGYTLTGVIREHVLGFLFGGGANGKSTYLSTLHAVMGDYAVRAGTGLLFASRGERHPTELTTLFGARLVTCSEVADGVAFDEARVKDLTGGDLISARRMREDLWTFAPSHKLYLAGNHKPQVRGQDDGIWRRIRLVPWLVTVPPGERDPELPEKLRAELPGILAWAVRGCLAWQREGLGEPQEVLDATAGYRADSDPLREFVDSYLVFGADEKVARQRIRHAYEEHCKETGAEPLGARRFVDGLRRHGSLEPTTVRVGAQVANAWRGVRLATDAEREASVGSRYLQVPVSGLSLKETLTVGIGNVATTGAYVPTEDDADERAAIQAEQGTC
jgi:putative DNA primase/helicase